MTDCRFGQSVQLWWVLQLSCGDFFGCHYSFGEQHSAYRIRFTLLLNEVLHGFSERRSRLLQFQKYGFKFLLTDHVSPMRLALRRDGSESSPSDFKPKACSS